VRGGPAATLRFDRQAPQRCLFQASPEISYIAPTGDGEFYAYSALWLGLGVLLLAYGVLAGYKPARLASAALVPMTVVKVFVLDLSGLEGCARSPSSASARR